LDWTEAFAKLAMNSGFGKPRELAGLVATFAAEQPEVVY
jgi:hypothetical protein